MPKSKQLPEIRTRLRSEDLARFFAICNSEGKTQAEVARSAILLYLDNYDVRQLDARESKLETRIRKMEERLAAMIMRPTLDVALLYEAIYYNFGADAPNAFAAFYNLAVKRLQKKRSDSSDKAAVKKLVNDLYRKDDHPLEARLESVDELSA